MNTIDKARSAAILKIANNNLAIMFKHLRGIHKPIRLAEIEAVYDRNVLGINADAKTKKGLKYEYLTGILYLSPAKLSGVNMCPKASAGCAAACLFTAGRGAFYSITRARTVKTLAYHFDTPRFVETVKKSIRQLVVKAKNKSLTPVVRLNGTSDLLFERNTDIIQSFPDVTFYDYSKITQSARFAMPPNYSLTFSLSETNEADIKEVLALGYNAAIVFRKELPATLWGYEVINGDDSDLRFNDKRGVIVGLRAKGKAKKDKSGFVRDYTGVSNDKIAA